MAFDPTPEAKALFETVSKRWNDLFSWGVETKLPSAKRQINDWTAYAAAWMAEREEYAPPDLPGYRLAVVPALGTEAVQLRSIEKTAAEIGYTDKGPIPGADIDVVQAGEGTRTAAQIDEAAKVAEEAAAHAKAEIAAGVGSLWNGIPWYWKLGAVVIGGAVAVGAVRR